nr:hypothetical protein [Tanacetum cinerariifolium]
MWLLCERKILAFNLLSLAFGSFLALQSCVLSPWIKNPFIGCHTDCQHGVVGVRGCQECVRLLERTLNDANPLKEVVSPYVIDGHVAMEVQSPLVAQTYSVKSHVVEETIAMECPMGRSSYARVLIKLRADVKLKDNIVMAMPKSTREGHYTCNVRVEYEWKPPRCSSCKVFGHFREECPKNTGAGEKKAVKKPSQTSRGVLKGVEPTIEVSNSNSFDVLNSIDNDVEFDTNGGNTNLINNEATSSGSSFMNIDNDGEFASNTPIGEKIDKIERQICEGKLRLLDNDGNPLVSTGIVESDSEVEVVFHENANLRISTSDKDGSDKGYGTNSLLEQWRDYYPDNNDYDPYDDDIYENHDLSEHLQSICDDLNITVRGRKKKYIFLMFVESIVI